MYVLNLYCRLVDAEGDLLKDEQQGLLKELTAGIPYVCMYVCMCVPEDDQRL